MKIDTNKLKSNSADATFLSLMGASHSGITEIPIDKLVSSEQPFKVLDNDEMAELAEDIKNNGVLQPIIVVPEGDQYRILAGHRRTFASKKAGLTTVPAIVKKDVKSEKNIIVNTNLLGRQSFLPSELAYAYKMQEEGYREMGVHSVRTSSKIAEENKVSRRTVQYYLRLTELMEPLLKLVDDEVITVKAGSALSYLSKDNQETLVDFITINSIKKINEKTADKILGLISANENLDFEKLNNLFFTNKDELKHSTYIVNSSDLEKTLFSLRQKVLLLDNSPKLKDGIVLEKKKYEKLLEAQGAIEKQLDIINKLIDNA